MIATRLLQPRWSNRAFPRNHADLNPHSQVVTLLDLDRAIGGAALRIKGQSADFGYVLGRQYRGRGLGTEVASAIVSLALSVPGISRVWATCDAANLGSARVLEKSGLVLEGVLRSFSVRPNISELARDALIYSRVR
ncbi:MAG TPA: GNAT family protein [Steroidobacteraceae bacterium]